jgi:drug/metabolite transporter (DMT)-like permease
VSVRLSGSLLAIAAALVWGTSWVATGLALRDLSPEAVAAWRGVGTFGLMAALLRVGPLRERVRRAPSQPRPQSGRLLRYLALALFGGPWFILGMNFAVQLTGATISAFVSGLYPVIAGVAAPLLLPERPSWAAVGGLFAAFVGILLLAGFDPLGLPVEGVAVALGAAVSFALFLLLARRWSVAWGLSPLSITAANFGVLALVAVPLAWMIGQDRSLPDLDSTAWLALGWLIVGPGVLANLFVLGSVRRLPAHESSSYLMLAPLAAAVLAAWLLDERLVPLQAIGAGLVLVGIASATVPFRRIFVRRPVGEHQPGVRRK